VTVRQYWTGSVFAVEWTIAGGEGATVTGAVATPSGPEAMPVEGDGNKFTATWTATEPGRHGWKLTATGVVEGSEEGSFTVQRSTVGLPPINTDPTTDVGMIRLLTTDLSEVTPLLTDPQIEGLLVAEGGSVKRAAASALLVISRSEVLISKKITTQDLSTDGPAVAKELRESARQLLAEAKSEEDAASAEDYGLEVVPLHRFPAAPPWGDWLL
jgi:hypothetical protein